ncbi:MAG: lipid A export permease/ATP-binding protein MsbA [Thermodesulfobacteriota bacterium]
MKMFMRLLEFVRPYWLTLVLAVVCMVVFAITNGAMAYLIGPAMKFLFSPDVPASRPLIPFDLFVIPREKMVMAIPLVIIAVAILRGLSAFGNTYYMSYVGQRVVTDLRKKFYEHTLTLPVDYFSSHPSGTLVSRLTADVNMLQRTTVNAVAVIFKQVLTVVALLSVVVYMDWELTLVALVAFPLALYPMRTLGKRMRRESKKGQITMGALTSLLYETITGVRVVKAFGTEEYEVDRFSRENERFTKYSLRTIRVRGMSNPLMEMIGAVGFALTIWYAAHRITSGTLAPESFISFFAAVLMLFRPLKALNGVHLSIQQGLAAASRVFEVMDTPGEFEARKGTEKITGLSEGVEFRGVSFSYGEEPVLKGVSLRVEKGEKVALVGASGEGKTTFVNLIPRFYDVTGGGIFIDGTDIRDIDLTSLRSQVAMVSQQVVLFNDTVRANIAYGDPERRMEDIRAAALAANAHDFISKLPDGYDTVIGEGGITLSGGQRQRVSIARAILTDVPILIMDEATSALDTESEVEVQKGLENLMEGRTSFVIAHRLSTVKNADRIIVFSGGSIVETGRHEELLALGGEYARVYNLQFGGQEKIA